MPDTAEKLRQRSPCGTDLATPRKRSIFDMNRLSCGNTRKGWPANGRHTPLHIISSPSDVLVVPPHGFNVILPAGQQPDKRLVVPPLRAAEWAIRRSFGIPDDVKPIKTWYPTEHVNLPRVPAIINHVNESRLALAGLAPAVEPEALPAPVLMPAAA